MSTFSETVKQDTPRVVVLFRRAPDGGEQFQWGVIGSIPVLTLIGYITRIQAELAFRSPEPCDQSALVIAYDRDIGKMCYFVHPDIPIDSMVGMLETIKGALVDSQVVQRQAAQQVQIIDPTGRPLRGN